MRFNTIFYHLIVAYFFWATMYILTPNRNTVSPYRKTAGNITLKKNKR